MIIASRNADLSALIKAGSHEIVAGEPSKLGGGDEGATPHELLEASLAACTIITVQMYANRKMWPLRSTNVEVRIDKEEAGAAHILREISFEGDLSQEQRERLLTIANKCPIHKLLSGKIEITTALVEGR
jgi:putative redox protein